MTRDLLESLAEAPDDPDLRLVVADAILERGGPRAELVSLEAERSTQSFDRKRELRYRALIEEHGAEWAGALDEWLLPENRVFEGGFLVAGKLNAASLAKKHFTSKQIAKTPEWRLIRDLELPPNATTNEALAILGHPQLVSLRGLYGLTSVAARTLTSTKAAKAIAPRLTSLGMRHIDESDVTLGNGRAFPALERLVVDWRESRGGGDWNDFTRTGLGASVRELEILASGEIIGWLPRLARAKVSVLTMNLGAEGGAWAAEGDWRLSLDLETHAMTAVFREGADVEKPQAHGLGVLLMNWRNPDGKVASLAIDGTYLARMQPAQRKRVEAVIRHVGITAEIRAEEEARAQAAAERSSFHYMNRLYVTADGRFAFHSLDELYKGTLGSSKTKIETRLVSNVRRELEAQGYRRTFRKATIAQVLRLLGRHVPPFLL